MLEQTLILSWATGSLILIFRIKILILMIRILAVHVGTDTDTELGDREPDFDL